MGKAVVGRDAEHVVKEFGGELTVGVPTGGGAASD